VCATEFLSGVADVGALATTGKPGQEVLNEQAYFYRLASLELDAKNDS